MKASGSGSVLTTVRRPSAVPVPAPTACTAPTQGMIAQRAYQKWLARGRLHNTEVQNWLEAEAELKAELSPRR